MGCGLAAPEQECEIARIVRVAAKPTHTRIHCGGSLRAATLNLYYEYMINLVRQPYLGNDPQRRFIDSMLLVDEADNIMKYNFDVLRQILLQGREFGVGVLLASQFLSHFKTRETDYSEPLLTWFVHKVPNVTPRELQSIGLNKVDSSTVERVKSLDVHHCLYKTLDVPGRFMEARPFYEIVGDSSL